MTIEDSTISENRTVGLSPGAILVLMGADLQLIRSNRAEREVRRLLWNNVFIEGWALYCEEMMKDALDAYIQRDLKLAEKLVSIMQRSHTVQETVRRELDWIEREFQVEVPSNIRSQMEKEALIMARRRWGVNRLRLKNRLIPWGGRKPRDI